MVSYKRIVAAKTTIEIIRYLSTQKSPVSLKILSKDLDLPTGTAMCYLATLEDEGFARKVGGDWMVGFGAALIRRKIKKQLIAERSEIDEKLKLIETQEKRDQGELQ